MTTNGKGIDWDGELQALMERSGIKPAEMVRTKWLTRARRKIFGARAFLVAAGITAPLMWLTLFSGAPAAAVVPLLVWLAGWIGYGIWISAGYPDWTTAGTLARDLALTGFHATSRFWFAHTRPARARWRAWRTAHDRDRTAPAKATA
ncbi:hypothetical protein H0264_28910 [Nocardia huaxiensis]|uniref:Uncharacterized protein n=1 Tax=Nocardia huaxiensis TaxID=2755382 RepID=A0A7D6V955_9NOCA|nr:hypothetical protein [Nocardia huaxiensis]QLY29271.1 hypothetical protein H0264_28910 [Nocardia huaxiensis]